MLNKQSTENRNQVGFYALDDLVPQDHLLRAIDEYVDFTFIYDLVIDKYDAKQGRPSIDPVLLMKLPLIQYLFGIKSMRQTIQDIEVNNAYRWFLGLDFMDKVPHFSTFGKNYVRRFKGTDIFEQLFYGILTQCVAAQLVDTTEVFIDGTHIKAHANRRKFKKVEVSEPSLFYIEMLNQEIQKDRAEHDKKSLKPAIEKNICPTKKISTTDPESGWFHKGDHKEVFAYSEQVACDRHGWVLGYTTHPGNLHDSRTFPILFEKLDARFELEKLIMDAGYKIPAIAHLLFQHQLTPIFPYKRPMTKKGFFKKYEYVYDDYYDVYLCPNHQILKYSTTNRKGYREYKSDPKICKNCPLLSDCTESRNHTKVITRHVWAADMERCEELRHTLGIKAIYDKRKATIERLFGTAKEFHGLRYTNQVGLEKMHAKVGLILACLNLKKLAKILKQKAKNKAKQTSIFKFKSRIINQLRKKTNARLIFGRLSTF